MKSIFTRISFGLVLALLSCRVSFAQIDMVQLARGAAEANDLEHAIQYLHQELNSNPQNVEAIVLYANIMNMIGQPELSAQTYSWGLRKVTDKKDRITLRRARASALLQLGIYPSVIVEAKNLISETMNSSSHRAGEDSSEDHHILAVAYLMQGDTLEALATLQNKKIYSYYKSDMHLHSLLTDILTSKRMVPETEVELKRLEKELKAAETKYQNDNQKLASVGVDKAYSSIIAANKLLDRPNVAAKYNVDAILKYGVVFSFTDNDYIAKVAEAMERELDSREHEIKGRPDGDYQWAELNNQLALLYRNISEYGKSVEHFFKAQHKDVNVTDRLFDLAKILIYANHSDVAFRLMDRQEAESCEGEDASSRLQIQRAMNAARTIFYNYAGDTDRALSALEQAGDMASPSNKSSLYYNIGDYEKAYETLKSESEEDNGAKVTSGMVNILRILGKEDEAMAMNENLLLMSDGDLVLAFAYAMYGDQEKAHENLSKVLDDPNPSFGTMIVAATVEFQLGNVSKGVEYLRRATDIDELSTFIDLNETVLLPKSIKESKEYIEYTDYVAQRRHALEQQLNTIIPSDLQ